MGDASDMGGYYDYIRRVDNARAKRKRKDSDSDSDSDDEDPFKVDVDELVKDLQDAIDSITTHKTSLTKNDKQRILHILRGGVKELVTQPR